MLQELGQRFIYNLGASYVNDMLGLNKSNPQDSIPMVAIKQGGIIYLIDQAEMMLMTGKPFDTDIMHVLDEVAFNSLAIWALTETQFIRLIDDVIPFNGQVQELVVSSVALTAVQELGRRIENGEIPILMPIKKLVSYVRSKL